MHKSVMEFLRRDVSVLEIAGRDVLEVGSQNVNGSPREVLMPHSPSLYVGVDFAPGRDVDHVLDVQKESFRQFFYPKLWDVVVSTEMLEHVEDWRSAVSNLKRVLVDGGLLILTTRGPGFPYHGYPHDYWRYTVTDFARIFADMEIAILKDDTDPKAPGVFLKAVKRPVDFEVDLSEIQVRPVR